MKLVHVIWHDAHSDMEGWTHVDEWDDDGAYVVHTAGWLMPTGQGGKRAHVSVAQSVSAHDAVDSVIHIPKAMVVACVVLREVEVDNEQAVTNAKRGQHAHVLSEEIDGTRNRGRKRSARAHGETDGDLGVSKDKHDKVQRQSVAE